MEVSLPSKIDYDWIAGFYRGESCFFINIAKTKNSKTGYSVQIGVSIVQHSRNDLLINSFVNTFKCGNIFKQPNYTIYSINKFKDIYNIIIPLFKKYEIKVLKF